MNHKLKFLLAGALALTALLAACGEPQGGVSPSAPSGSVQDTQTPAPSGSAQDTQTSAPSGSAESTTPAQQSSEEPSAGTPEPSDPEVLKELALTFIGEDVDDLIAAIGEPSGSDYAPSCLGSGEDGELFYDGFSVYTYREGDTETVQDVL